jgi:hypothetical protein
MSVHGRIKTWVEPKKVIMEVSIDQICDLTLLRDALKKGEKREWESPSGKVYETWHTTRDTERQHELVEKILSSIQ